MAEESFLLVSLKEGKSKELAQVISNETSRVILDLLSKKDATETEISNSLKLPLSTVHYNLQNLLKAELVKIEEFHYSEKGKEINHYKLSNKFIIIAPSMTDSIKEKLKKILPVGLLAIATAGFIQLYSYRYELFMENAAPLAGAQAQDEAVMLAAKAAPAAQPLQTQPNIALWFLFGALFVIVISFIIEKIRKK